MIYKINPYQHKKIKQNNGTHKKFTAVGQVRRLRRLYLHSSTIEFSNFMRRRCPSGTSVLPDISPVIILSHPRVTRDGTTAPTAP